MTARNNQQELAKIPYKHSRKGQDNCVKTQLDDDLKLTTLVNKIPEGERNDDGVSKNDLYPNFDEGKFANLRDKLKDKGWSIWLKIAKNTKFKKLTSEGLQDAQQKLAQYLAKYDSINKKIKETALKKFKDMPSSELKGQRLATTELHTIMKSCLGNNWECKTLTGAIGRDLADRSRAIILKQTMEEEEKQRNIAAKQEEDRLKDQYEKIHSRKPETLRKTELVQLVKDLREELKTMERALEIEKDKAETAKTTLELNQESKQELARDIQLLIEKHGCIKKINWRNMLKEYNKLLVDAKDTTKKSYQAHLGQWVGYLAKYNQQPSNTVLKRYIDKFKGKMVYTSKAKAAKVISHFTECFQPSLKLKYVQATTLANQPRHIVASNEQLHFIRAHVTSKINSMIKNPTDNLNMLEQLFGIYIITITGCRPAEAAVIVKHRGKPEIIQKNTFNVAGGKYGFRKCSYVLQIPLNLNKTSVHYKWKISDKKDKKQMLESLTRLPTPSGQPELGYDEDIDSAKLKIQIQNRLKVIVKALGLKAQNIKFKGKDPKDGVHSLTARSIRCLFATKWAKICSDFTKVMGLVGIEPDNPLQHTTPAITRQRYADQNAMRIHRDIWAEYERIYKKKVGQHSTYHQYKAFEAIKKNNPNIVNQVEANSQALPCAQKSKTDVSEAFSGSKRTNKAMKHTDSTMKPPQTRQKDQKMEQKCAKKRNKTTKQKLNPSAIVRELKDNPLQELTLRKRAKTMPTTSAPTTGVKGTSPDATAGTRGAIPNATAGTRGATPSVTAGTRGASGGATPGTSGIHCQDKVVNLRKQSLRRLDRTPCSKAEGATPCLKVEKPPQESGRSVIETTQ